MNFRVTMVLLVVLSLVGGYLLYVGAPGGAGEGTEPAPWFYSASMSDIVRIQVAAGDRGETFVRSEQGWLFEGAESIPVDMDRWGGVTLLLSGPQSRRLLAGSLDDPGRYGLDVPSITIDVTLRGDRVVQIALGDLTPDGAAYYATLGGDPGLYLVDSLWGQVLARLVTEPPLPQWFYRIDPARLVFLGVAAEGSEVQFTNDSSGWRFATLERTPVDAERWAEVEAGLGGPPSLRILSPTIPTEEFGRYGLLEPRATIQVEYDPPPTLESPRRFFEMEVGGLTEDGVGHYAKVAGQPYLLFVDAPWVAAMERLALEPPVGGQGGG